MAIFLLATLDTKGLEAAFVRDRLTSLGLAVTNPHRLSFSGSSSGFPARQPPL